MRGNPLQPFGLGFLAAAGILFTFHSQAVTIVSGPGFATAPAAPLAGVLSLTTDTSSRVSVFVDDGVEPWERDFFDFNTTHSITLLGFKPNRTNEITVTVTDKNRNTFTLSNAVSFVTGPLPSNFPNIILVTNNPSMMEPGYTLFRAANQTTGGSYSMFVDQNGEVVWYSPLTTPSDLWQMTNGDLFFPLTSTAGFEEANMLGQMVRQWLAPSGYSVDSHEDVITPHGTILYINYAKEKVTNFPSSDSDPNAPLVTTNVSYNRVVEIPYANATNAHPLNSWSLIDMLQPTRIDYLCYNFYNFYGVDPEHANCVLEDPADNTLIVSMRNQDAVIKMTRSGQIKWILGDHANWGPEFQQYLLTPVGTPFVWNYGQHAPVLTSRHTILLYDDGNARAEPWAPWTDDRDNYSRAVEYQIDETNMTVTQVWQYANVTDDRLFTGFVGNATQQPKTGNVLVTYGAIEYENGVHPSIYATNANMVRLKEVTYDSDPQVVFDLELWDPTNTAENYAGYQVYRSRRVPDLYVHPALPVADLTVTFNQGAPLLQFSGDPYRTYDVQSSTNLVNWVDLGAPDMDEANGEYSFEDDASMGQASTFYRVITQ